MRVTRWVKIQQNAVVMVSNAVQGSSIKSYYRDVPRSWQTLPKWNFQPPDNSHGSCHLLHNSHTHIYSDISASLNRGGPTSPPYLCTGPSKKQLHSQAGDDDDEWPIRLPWWVHAQEKCSSSNTISNIQTHFSTDENLLLVIFRFSASLVSLPV